MLASSSSLSSKWSILAKSACRRHLHSSPLPSIPTVIRLHPTVNPSIALPRSSVLTRRPVISQHRSLTALIRGFTSTHAVSASLASHPPGEDTQLVYHPTPESLRTFEEDDVDENDIDLIPLEEAQLQITERAAEVLRILAYSYSFVPTDNESKSSNSNA